MSPGGFKVMLTALTESDPLRHMYDARFFGIHYRLCISGSTIEILNADLDDKPIGKIHGSPTEGFMWRGNLNCIARDTYNSAKGYTVTPIEDGVPQPKKATSVHPIDYFFAYWRDLQNAAR